MEVMWMKPARRLKNLSPPEVVFADCVIPISSHVRSLGVIIDSALTFSDHVTRLVNLCFYRLRQIRSVRRSLMIDSAHAIVRALILARLDYCNSLLAGLPNTLLCRLYGVMRGWPGSYFNSSTETTSAIRCVINSIGWTLHRGLDSNCASWCLNVEMMSRHRISYIYVPVVSVIVFAVCCFRWLSRSCVFHSDSRSTCVCCILSGLLELTPSWHSGTWNLSGDFQKETENFPVLSNAL